MGEKTFGLLGKDLTAFFDRALEEGSTLAESIVLDVSLGWGELLLEEGLFVGAEAANDLGEGLDELGIHGESLVRLG